MPNRIAARPTPPEKKERQETRGKENALEVPRRRLINLFVLLKTISAKIFRSTILRQQNNIRF